MGTSKQARSHTHQWAYASSWWRFEAGLAFTAANGGRLITLNPTNYRMLTCRGCGIFSILGPLTETEPADTDR